MQIISKLRSSKYQRGNLFAYNLKFSNPDILVQLVEHVFNKFIKPICYVIIINISERYI